MTDTTTAKTTADTVRELARSVARGRTQLEAIEPATSREAYLEERAAWRQAYAEIAREIRALKAERRNPDIGDWARNSANEDRQRLRSVARAMIDIRLQSKARAREASRVVREARVAAPAVAAA